MCITSSHLREVEDDEEQDLAEEEEDEDEVERELHINDDSEVSDTESPSLRGHDRVQVSWMNRFSSSLIDSWYPSYVVQIRSERDMLMDAVLMQGPPAEIDLRNGFVGAKQLILRHSRYGPFQGKWTTHPLDKQFAWEVSGNWD